MVVPTRPAREVNRNRLQEILPGPYDELVVETPPSLAERLLRLLAPADGRGPAFPVGGGAGGLAVLRARFQ